MKLPLQFQPQPKGTKMKTIGKTDLVADISANTPFTKGCVEAVIAELLDSITSYTAAGHKVQIKGFGTFQMQTWLARTARNPRTGEPVQVPERQKLTFKASKGA